MSTMNSTGMVVLMYVYPRPSALSAWLVKPANADVDADIDAIFDAPDDWVLFFCLVANKPVAMHRLLRAMRFSLPGATRAAQPPAPPPG